MYYFYNLNLFYEFQGVSTFERRDYLAFGNYYRIILWEQNLFMKSTYSDLQFTVNADIAFFYCIMVKKLSVTFKINTDSYNVSQ